MNAIIVPTLGVTAPILALGAIIWLLRASALWQRCYAVLMILLAVAIESEFLQAMIIGPAFVRHHVNDLGAAVIFASWISLPVVVSCYTSALWYIRKHPDSKEYFKVHREINAIYAGLALAGLAVYGLAEWFGPIRLHIGFLRKFGGTTPYDPIDMLCIVIGGIVTLLVLALAGYDLWRLERKAQPAAGQDNTSDREAVSVR